MFASGGERLSLTIGSRVLLATAEQTQGTTGGSGGQGGLQQGLGLSSHLTGSQTFFSAWQPQPQGFFTSRQGSGRLSSQRQGSGRRSQVLQQLKHSPSLKQVHRSNVNPHRPHLEKKELPKQSTKRPVSMTGNSPPRLQPQPPFDCPQPHMLFDTRRLKWDLIGVKLVGWCDLQGVIIKKQRVGKISRRTCDRDHRHRVGQENLSISPVPR